MLRRNVNFLVWELRGAVEFLGVLGLLGTWSTMVRCSCLQFGGFLGRADRERRANSGGGEG